MLAKEFIEARLKNNESIIFVALDRNKPVGFTQLYPTFSSVRAIRNWILNDLFVEKAFRNQGMGEKLIEKAIEFARENGAKSLELSTAIDNLNAQRLYEKLGFVNEGTFSEFYSYRKSLII